MQLDGVWVDVIMVRTLMLCGNGWGLGGRYNGWDMDALLERMGSGWTLSWLGHGCSEGTGGLWVESGWMWTSAWLGHGCSGP